MEMGMKGVYLTTYDVRNQSDGVAKKILSQIKCFQDVDIDMEIVDANHMPISKYFSWRKKMAKVFSTAYTTGCLYDYLIDKIDLKKIQFVYVRKGYCDMKQIRSLKKIKKINPVIQILMEIPTFPYDQEFGGRRKILAIPRDKKARMYLHKYVDKIVTYSNDKKIFGMPTLRISNGIDYERISLKSSSCNHEGIHLIAVAFLDYWHGYDRLLLGMAKEQELVRKNGLVFHLVGDGRALASYKQIVKENKLEKHVMFHGRLYGEKLDAVYDECDIGIDTLGRHRVGISYNSTLKGKEYCAKGLPIISGVTTELDSMNCTYYYRVPANDDPISIKEIIQFYHRIYDGKDPKLIAKSIREESKKYFDFPNTFAPIVEYIKKNAVHETFKSYEVPK